MKVVSPSLEEALEQYEEEIAYLMAGGRMKNGDDQLEIVVAGKTYILRPSKKQIGQSGKHSGKQ